MLRRVGRSSEIQVQAASMSSAALQVMDLTSLRAVLAELRGELLPSRFEKAQQPSPQTLQLGFRTLSGLIWLELCWRAEAARLVRIPPPSRQGTGSTLAQQVQHGLRQLALISLEQKGFERVVNFGLANRPGEPVQRTLVLELMGRHSNLLLLDPQTRVIALGRQVRNHQSRIRPIGTGDIYAEPPPLQSLEPCATESMQRWRQRLCVIPNTVQKALQECYQGISPALALQLAGDNPEQARELLRQPIRDLDERQWHRLYQRWCCWLEQLEQGRFRLRFDGPTAYRVWDGEAGSAPSPPEKGLSLGLGHYYREQLHRRELNQLTNDLQQRLNRWRDREQKALSEQQQRLDATAESGALQQQADAILCQPSPNREQIEAAQKLYKLARKLRRSSTALLERMAHHRQRIQLIQGSESFLEDLAAAGWEPPEDRLSRLQDLRRELDELLTPSPRQQRKNRGSSHQPPQPLELSTPGGLRLQIGRNHRQNDWISLRQARPGDLWFHAQECPGSHVVLKVSAGLAEQADLQLAADLAAHFSRARGNQRVAVIVVPTEQLQRIPGTAPGTVRHRGGEVFWAEPDRGLQHLSSLKPLA